MFIPFFPLYLLFGGNFALQMCCPDCPCCCSSHLPLLAWQQLPWQVHPQPFAGWLPYLPWLPLLRSLSPSQWPMPSEEAASKGSMGHTPSTAGTFRKNFRKNSGKTPETLSELFLEFPSRVPRPCNSRHLKAPEHFQNSLPPRYGWGRFFLQKWASQSRSWNSRQYWGYF